MVKEMAKQELVKLEIQNKKGYTGEEIKKNPQCYVKGELVKAGDVVTLEKNSSDAKILLKMGYAKVKEGK